MTHPQTATFHDGRNCRSIQDALNQLRHLGALVSGPARIFARLVPRPDYAVTGVITVTADFETTKHCVQLPNFTHFKGKTWDDTPVLSGIAILNEASVHETGRVTLASGQHIRAVEFKPALPLMYD